MRVGIMGAMHEEMALVQTDLVGPQEESAGGRVYCRGSLYGCEAVLAFSRWGKVASACTAATLLARHKTDVLVFFGVAGAVSPELAIGDIVIASELTQHDLDARPIFPQCEVPLLNVSRFRTPSRLLGAAREAAIAFARQGVRDEVESAVLERFGIASPRVVEGLIASGDQFIAGMDQRAALRERLPDLACVEMEGAAVAQVCFEYGVPCLVIRAISDRADDAAAGDFSQFVSQVARHYSRGILRRLLPLLRGLDPARPARGSRPAAPSVRL